MNDIKNLNIQIGEGVGDFKFGATREEIKQAVGEPDEIEKGDDGIEDGGLIEVWHYDEYELSVEFIELFDWKLGTIAINSEDCRLNELSIIGKSLNEVTNMLENMDLGEFESQKLELEDEEMDVVMVSAIDAGIDFWFENDLLTEVQVSAIVE